MAPGFRYHVVTVIAIFLALGVGIAVGSSFVSGALVDKMSRQVADLRIQIKNQVTAAQESNRQYGGFVAAIGPRLVENHLLGRRIAIVQTGDYPETTAKVREALQQAGAVVSSVTVVERSYPTRFAAEQETLLPRLRQSRPALPADSGAPFYLLAEVLAHGGQDADLAPLADARLLRIDGDYSHPSDHVVLVGGAAVEGDARADTVDIPLIAQLKRAQLAVMEVEPSVAAVSYVAALRESDVTTVDNADTDIGRIGVVLALRAERGSYGTKSGSQDGVIPAAPSDDIRRHTGL